jgi:hypothetical protein
MSALGHKQTFFDVRFSPNDVCTPKADIHRCRLPIADIDETRSEQLPNVPVRTAKCRRAPAYLVTIADAKVTDFALYSAERAKSLAVIS